MDFKALIYFSIKIIFAVAVVAVGIIFQDNFDSLYKKYVKGENIKNNKSNNLEVFSKKQLSRFNGIDKEKHYLAILGSIFDVTEGKKHYQKDAPYHYFIGKDGSRAFITGDFSDESEKKDHVLDRSCYDLLALLDWKKTLGEKYIPVGVLIGRYYDETGKSTEYNKQLGARIVQCKQEEDMKKKDAQKYPPCNMEWSVDEGTRVWCTKTSGGVSRSWVGVPRQLYSPGEKNPRCVCIDLQKDHSLSLLKEYENCTATATSCNVG